jgi:RNA methyltransferase, TrmH family
MKPRSPSRPAVFSAPRTSSKSPVYDPNQIPRPRKVPEGVDRKDEIKACGINACKAIFKARPKDLVRAYVTEELVKEFSAMLRVCAADKKAYHIVTTADLAKISGSSHHEGVCVIAKAKKALDWSGLKAELSKNKRKSELVLILEDVANPHNVGAILRSAANFGVKAVLAPGVDFFKPSSALLRTAEGGEEALSVTGGPELKVIIDELKDLNFEIVAADSKAKTSLFEEEALSPRVAFIIGNEGRGISPEAKKQSDQIISIPGTGAVESLNVSTATAVICSEFWRAHRIH